MSTASELREAGVEKMRLPQWNEHAFLLVPAEGPWAKLFDVGAGLGGGEPISMLVAVCDSVDRWVPA